MQITGGERMTKYIIKRVLQSMLTVLLIVSVVFLLMRLMPTDYYFTEDQLIKLTDQQKHDILQSAGMLDHPLVQLWHYLTGIITRFDFGASHRIMSNHSVIEVIGNKFAISMEMGLIALVVSIIIGVVLGILQARFKDSLLDHIGTGYTVFVNAVPHLVSYSLLLVFGYKVLGLPAVYSTRKVWKWIIFGNTVKVNYSLIVPILCLALGSIASYMLWMRRYMVDELNKDYIRLAKLKGLSTTQVMFRHVMKNAFLPLAQYLPYSVLLTVGGSLLVERFFSIPGIGSLMTDAIGKYDVNVVQALVIMYATLGILGLLLGDILMTLLDPRISLTGKGGTR